MGKKILPIAPVSKEWLYMKVADAINSFINENNLYPGERIPSERVLAEQLGTSRNSVREALRILQSEGILEVKIGKGAFIASSVASDSICLRLFKINYIELWQIKTMLEREAIRGIIRTSTDKQIQKLEAPLIMLEEAEARKVYSQEADKLFHLELLNLCENHTLAQMTQNIMEALTAYAKRLDLDEFIWIATVPFHRQLFDALKARDVGRACEAHDKILEIDTLLVLNGVVVQ